MCHRWRRSRHGLAKNHRDRGTLCVVLRPRRVIAGPEIPFPVELDEFIAPMHGRGCSFETAPAIVVINPKRDPEALLLRGQTRGDWIRRGNVCGALALLILSRSARSMMIVTVNGYAGKKGRLMWFWLMCRARGRVRGGATPTQGGGILAPHLRNCKKRRPRFWKAIATEAAI